MTNQEFIESIRLENEEWRPVVGYEDYYIVSSLGRVAVLGRKSVKKSRWGETCEHSVSPHLCRTSKSPSSWYIKMTFVVNGIKQTKTVHSLVAKAFLPNPNNYPCVDHINDNPLDNRACNLQWCTYKLNNSKEHHRKASSMSQKGRIDPKRKPLVAIDQSGNKIQFESMWEANRYGHISSAILRVLRGQLHTHHGLKWMYLSEPQKTLTNQESKELSPMQ